MFQRYLSGIMNDELYGQLYKPTRLGNFSFMALSIVHAKTLREVLKRIVDFYNLFENSFSYHFEEKGNLAEFSLKHLPGQSIADDYAINSVLTIIHRFCCWLINERILLNQVKLDFSPPCYRDEYRYIFYGAPVLFNQEQISISFASGYLDYLIVQNEASVNNYLRRAPLDIYLPIDAAGRLTISVRQQIKQAFSQDGQLLTLSKLAENLALHPQTLRRRLKSEGTSFEVLKAQVRRDIAIHYLSQAETRIEAVSEQCGYSEPSAFIRAFKQWTGFTPLQFRKGLDIKSR